MNKEKRKVVQEVDKELNNNNNNEENDIKEDDNENNKNNVKEEDNNNEEENKEDKSEEKETSNTNNTSSTDANKPEETESVIHIIESGTDDGYQKSEEENWMTECFKRGSIKDEAIILLFLGSTGILLVYASMKKCFANNYEDGMKYNYTTLNNSN
ncbi:hypothetical protein BCR36DRAFT_587814 [Piromyces finnis]|uniref:Uncharacterized protein n=1 Tax=Piromyces finnis TaxID=1754191 RepID=A0A1Y1UVR7_9FUNG|nr:hypothetical protein BCR36DRAFT_587814 [Piromyces finnis]|eukprot:ORX41704.1 hypothetical protein BCR36DRAFT_587814 [Piromyces finnis]